MEDKTQTNAVPVPQAQNPITQNETNYEYAGIGVRAIANLIDAIILSIITIPIIILVGFMQNDSITTAVSGFISIGQYFYYVYFIGKSGQTLGKKAMKIKVIKLDNKEHLDYVGAFLREVVGKFISGIVLGLGFLWVLWDKQKQGWHDKIAGTIVVKVKDN